MPKNNTKKKTAEAKNSNPVEMPRLLNARKVSEALGISTATVYRMMSEGRLKHYSIGDLLFTTPEFVLAWLQECEVTPRAERIRIAVDTYCATHPCPIL